MCIRDSLNHAAETRVRTLAGLHQFAGAVDEAELNSYRVELEITGARQEYVGDPHVWCWYRGTAVGPYPCISALQALVDARALLMLARDCLLYTSRCV